MGIKLHASVLHRENMQLPVHEVFAHQFRLPRRGEELAQFLILLCFRIARGGQKTLGCSFETEPQGKSEGGKAPPSRSIKQFFTLDKLEKLDGQRGEKAFSTR